MRPRMCDESQLHGIPGNTAKDEASSPRDDVEKRAACVDLREHPVGNGTSGLARNEHDRQEPIGSIDDDQRIVEFVDVDCASW